MSAGLTGLEARVFLTLYNLQKATVSEISKKSSIDRSNIYKTLQKLEDLKLVERDLDTTSRYNPVPLPVAISIQCTLPLVIVVNSNSSVQTGDGT